MMKWKCQKSTLALLLMFLLLSLAQVSAGVVEDAEEELKKLKKTGSAVRTGVSVGGGEAPSFPNPESPDLGGAVSRGVETRGVGESQGRSSGKRVGVVNLGQEKPEAQAPPPRRSNRVERDRLYSIFGILVLLALVAAGTVFSKDGFKDS